MKSTQLVNSSFPRESSIPLVGKSKQEATLSDEANVISERWNGGYFEFLSLRTKLKCDHKSTKERRNDIESQGISCSLVSDRVLEALYFEANRRFYYAFTKRFPHSNPFTTTPSEKAIQATIRKIVKDNPRYQDVLFLPLNSDNKSKWTVGCHVPDVLVLGLKRGKYTAIAFEVMGGIHELKAEKDRIFFEHMEELGILVLAIYNEQASDYAYIKGILDDLTTSDSSNKLDEQTLRLKRKIWVKTISLFMSLDDIERFVHQKFDLSLNLEQELEALLKMPNCPRAISKEEKRNRFWRPSIRVSNKGTGVTYTLVL